jgi:hypothetical protein
MMKPENIISPVASGLSLNAGIVGFGRSGRFRAQDDSALESCFFILKPIAN